MWTQDELQEVIDNQNERIDELEQRLETVSFAAALNESVLLKVMTSLEYISDDEYPDYIQYLLDFREEQLEKYAEENDVPIYKPGGGE